MSVESLMPFQTPYAAEPYIAASFSGRRLATGSADKTLVRAPLSSVILTRPGHPIGRALTFHAFCSDDAPRRGYGHQNEQTMGNLPS